MQFVDLRLSEPILRALISEGYQTATAIQAQAIPPALEGRDVLGSAQTGTGKTAAFALPILQRLTNSPRPTGGQTPKARCLVLCPTRELATQIADAFAAYGKNLKLRQTTIFGGVNQNPQVTNLRRGVDVIVATPGRLLDLMNQGHVDLRAIEVLVLDEADRMLDMGFIHDIKKITAQVPKQRQTLLFSATMPTEIKRLADSLLREPAVIQLAPASSTAAGIDECVYFVERGNKGALLAHLVNNLPMSRAIVFTRTKHGADRVVRALHSRGIRSEAIHGNKTQNARQRALDNFRANKIPVLVATDIASRGIDVDDVSHVVNYDLTHEPETYVHRIGRTARAGAQGMAVSFCDREERDNLRAIEKLLKRSIPIKSDHPVYVKNEPVLANSGESARDERSESRGERPHRQGHSQGNGGRGQGGHGYAAQSASSSSHHRPTPQKPQAKSVPTGRGVTAHPRPTPVVAHAAARPAHAKARSGNQRSAHPIHAAASNHRGGPATNRRSGRGRGF